LDVLRARAQANQSCREGAQDWEPAEQSQDERKRVAATGGAPIDATVNHDLEPLHKAHGKFPALLHLVEIG